MSPERRWIERLGLEPHPEGGWFKRIYTGAPRLDIGHGPRAAATSIYYLLTREQARGCLHSNRSDILHFLIDGGPLEYCLVNAAGELRCVGLKAGEELFLHAASGDWKASRLTGAATHALVAEVVVPGFDWADHRYVDRDEVKRRCPQHLLYLKPFLR